jgi:hypothetical protein
MTGMRLYITSLLLVLLLTPETIFSQTDVEFWFAAPEITESHCGGTPATCPGGEPIFFRISAIDLASTVRINQPANPSGLDTSFTVPANSTVSINASAWINDLENKPGGIVLNKGIHIISTNLITVYYDIDEYWNMGIFTLKGKNALGKEFYTPFNNLWSNGNYTPVQPCSSIDIVATEDNTQITITPTADLSGGHPAFIPFIITLNRGQTFSCQATSQKAAGHLGGTHIVSNKPVAVTIKDDSVAANTCRDIIGDQIVPIMRATDNKRIVGYEYIVTRGKINIINPGADPPDSSGVPTGERIFIMATKPSTQVFIDDTLFATLINAGDQAIYELRNNSTHVRGDKPVMVLHVSGFGCELDGAILPTIDGCTGSVEVSFTRSAEDDFCLNIITIDAARDAFTMHYEDGSTFAIPGGWFEPVGATGFVCLKRDHKLFPNSAGGGIPRNEAVKITNSVSVFHLGILEGYRTKGCKYGYFSGYTESRGSAIVVETGSQSVFRCPGDSIQLRATGGLSYTWTPPDYLDDSFIATPVAKPPPGVYNYHVTINRPCFADTSLNIIIGIHPRVSFFESFDDSPGAKPSGWTTIKGSNSVDWQFVNGGGTTTPEIPESGKPPSAYSGETNALFFYESDGQEYTYLITPPIEFFCPVKTALRFRHAQIERNTGSEPAHDELSIYYKTNSSQRWEDATKIAEFTDVVSEWTEQTVLIPWDIFSPECYFAFKATTNNGWGVCIDDVEIEEAVEPLRYLDTLTIHQASDDMIPTGTVNNPVLRIDLVVKGKIGTVTLKSINVTSLNTSDSDIQSGGVKLFYNHFSDHFYEAIPYDTASLESGQAVFDGLDLNLPTGNTSVWITFDIKPDAIHNYCVDAMIKAGDICVQGDTYPSVDVSPPGSRLIQKTVFYDDFTLDKGWTLAGDFQRNRPNGLGGNFFGNPDPEYAAWDTMIIGNDLTGLGDPTRYGDYEPDIPRYGNLATSPPINLNNYRDTRLNFLRWLNVANNDTASIELSIDNGNTWNEIWSNNNSVFTDSAWIFSSQALQEANGQPNVRIRFNLGPTTTTENYSGWNIDNFSITGLFSQPETLVAYISDSTNITCYGYSDGTATVTAAGGTPPYTYIWDDPESTSSAVISGLEAMKYYHVTVTDYNGCHSVDSVMLTSAEEIAVSSDYPKWICPGSMDGYVNLSVSGGTPPYTYYWSNGQETQNISDLSKGEYSVTITDDNNCQIEHSVNIMIPQTYQGAEICIVTIDETSEKNIVVWEKTSGQGIGFYKIYKETTTSGIYQPIGIISYDETGMFTDTLSDPRERAARYKLSILDTCNMESGLSGEHKTIHLSANVGITGETNLLWDQYIGFNYNSYNIYRGTHKDSLEFLTSIQSNLTSFSDFNSPGSPLYYLIEVVAPYSCNPGAFKSTNEYNASRSNIIERTASYIQNDIIQDDLKLYPNPFNESTTITFDNPERYQYTFYLNDLTGKVIRRVDNITGEKIELNRDGLPAGLYLIELRGPKIFRSKLLIE